MHNYTIEPDEYSNGYSCYHNKIGWLGSAQTKPKAEKLCIQHYSDNRPRITPWQPKYTIEPSKTGRGYRCYHVELGHIGAADTMEAAEQLCEKDHYRREMGDFV